MLLIAGDRYLTADFWIVLVTWQPSATLEEKFLFCVHIFQPHLKYYKTQPTYSVIQTFFFGSQTPCNLQLTHQSTVGKYCAGQRRQSGSESGGSWIRLQKFSIPVEKISDFPAQKFWRLFLVVNSKNYLLSKNIHLSTFSTYYILS